MLLLPSIFVVAFDEPLELADSQLSFPDVGVLPVLENRHHPLSFFFVLDLFLNEPDLRLVRPVHVILARLEPSYLAFLVIVGQPQGLATVGGVERVSARLEGLGIVSVVAIGL